MPVDRPRTLLLVEDEAIIALNERAVLERNGFRVEVVHSGEAAVEAVRRDAELDLVLMDIDLGPGMDGTEASRRILDIRELPVVFLTSHAEPEYVERVEQISGYGYVLKSAGEFVLVRSVEMALRLCEAHARTEREKERYRLITENASETILTVDTELNITYVSPSIEQLTGFTPEEYRRMSPSEQLTEESARWVVETGHMQQRDPNCRTGAAELERVCKDGGTVWTETISRPIVTDDGEVIGHVATIRDITDRVRHRAELEESEARYRSVVENTNDALIIHDFDGIITFVNPGATRLLGYAADELVGMPLQRLHAPGSREQLEGFATDRRWRDRVVIEQELRAQDGTVIPVEVSASIASRAGRGEIQAFVKDIRGRREAEDSFGVIYERTEEAIAMWDRDGRLLRTNTAGAARFGRSASELHGMSLFDLYPHGAAERALAGLRAVFESGTSRNADWWTEIGGLERCFLVHSEPVMEADGGVRAVTTFSTDITGLKRSEEHYRLIAENARDVVAVLDSSFVPIYVSPSVEPLLGYAPEDLADTSLFSLIHEEDRPTVWKRMEEVIERRGEHLSLDMRARARDGRALWLDASSTFMYDEEGRFLRSVSAVRDITARKRLERDLQSANARLEATLNAMPDLFFELDEGHRFLSYRAPESKGLYVAAEEFLGRTIHEVLPSDVASRFAEALETATGADGTTAFDYSLTQEGVTRFFRASIAKQPDGGAPKYIVLVHEVTDLVRTREGLEAALARNEHLMREIHHRVKNNLAIVSSLIELKDQVIPDVDLSDLSSQVAAVRFVHEQLQTGGEQDEIELRSYLDALLESLFHSLYPGDVHIDLDAGGISLSGGRAVSVGLLVNEIATNAVKHSFDDTEPNRFAVSLSRQDGSYVLSVSNSGAPVPEHIDIENPPSLGLQLITGLVAQLGGTLELQRRPHPAYTILFPVEEERG